jgi:hypothetical protein
MSDAGDSFTEITHKSWFSRIGATISGVLFGLILLLGSSVLLFWNEGRAVQTVRSLVEGRTLVVDVDPARGSTRATRASSSMSAATSKRRRPCAMRSSVCPPTGFG